MVSPSVAIRCRHLQSCGPSAEVDPAPPFAAAKLANRPAIGGSAEFLPRRGRQRTTKPRNMQASIALPCSIVQSADGLQSSRSSRSLTVNRSGSCEAHHSSQRRLSGNYSIRRDAVGGSENGAYSPCWTAAKSVLFWPFEKILSVVGGGRFFSARFSCLFSDLPWNELPNSFSFVLAATAVMIAAGRQNYRARCAERERHG